MWIELLWLLLGFILLTVGGNTLVGGASSLAKRFKVSDLIIGLTVVAMGTSAPEFMVNIMSAVHHTNEIALTNILGSNIINTLVILGLVAIIHPIDVRGKSIKALIFLSFLMALVLILLTYFVPNRTGEYGLGLYAGLVLLLFFVGYMIHNFREVKRHPSPDPVVESSSDLTLGSRADLKREKIKDAPVLKSIVLILIGLGGLMLGANLIVTNAVKMAAALGVSEAIIGLTVVALGTSLPELATSIIAAYHKNAGLALGNIIGSNIFNISLVLGASAVINPLTIYPGFWVDAMMACFSALLVIIVAFVPYSCARTKAKPLQTIDHKGENKPDDIITKCEGGALLLIYGVYLAYKLDVLSTIFH